MWGVGWVCVCVCLCVGGGGHGLVQTAALTYLLGATGEVIGEGGTWQPGGSTGPPVMMRVAISAPTKASPAAAAAAADT